MSSLEYVIKARSVLSCFLYEKILKLDYQTILKLSSGRIINSFSDDIKTLPSMCDSLVVSFYFIFISLCSMGLIIYLYGFLTFLVTFTSVTLLLLLECYLAKLNGQMKFEITLKTDKRINLMYEILHGLQTIKILVWEKKFMESIVKLRNQELSKIFYTFVLKSIYISMAFSSSKIVIFISIFTIFFTKSYKFDFSLFFTYIAIVSSLEEFFVYVSTAINVCSEGFKFISRMEDFMKTKEKPINSKNSLELKLDKISTVYSVSCLFFRFHLSLIAISYKIF